MIETKKSTIDNIFYTYLLNQATIFKPNVNINQNFIKQNHLFYNLMAILTTFSLIFFFIDDYCYVSKESLNNLILVLTLYF